MQQDTGANKKPDEQEPKPTGYLNLPPSTTRPPQRPPTTSHFVDENCFLKLKMGKKTVRLPVVERILVGRTVGSAEVQHYLDLTNYGGYQGGVSREHAEILLRNGLLYVQDLGSTNGTRINGFQLQPHQLYRLRNGDELEFAQVNVTVTIEIPRR